MGTPEHFWINKQMVYEYAITKQIFDTSNLISYKEALGGDQEEQDKQEEQKTLEYEEKTLTDDLLGSEEVILSDEEHPHHKVFDKF